MAATKSKGPIVDPALCRCCRNIKKCRILTEEYEFSGSKEVYSDMFMDCFGLLLSHLDGDSAERGVCATCVVRLRDAAAFRSQVLRCEQAFLDARMDHKMEVEVKMEPACEDEPPSPPDDSDPDYTLPALEPISKPAKGSEDEGVSLRTRAGRGRGRGRGRPLKDVAGRIRKLKTKMDSLLDQEDVKPPIKKLTPSQKRKVEPELQDMIHTNAIEMVINSYVCPFLNRISNYYCYYCRDQFTDPVELREHTLTHDPKKDFEAMMEYKKIPKIDITRIDCRLCAEKITDINTLRKHLSTTHSIKLHQITNEFLTFKLNLDKVECTECGITFPYFDALKKHMTDHFGTYICDQCGACFLEQNTLRTHIKSHSRVESFFPCEICGKTLKSKYSKYLHIATVHEKKPTVNCYKCEASFLSYAQRNRHLIEVHGDKRTFACKQCDKVYNRRKTLMEHTRRNHLKVYRHQCAVCEQRFYLPSRLREHMASHTGERRYRCEFCDKSYPRLQSLQEHVRSHSDRRFKKTTFDAVDAFTG